MKFRSKLEEWFLRIFFKDTLHKMTTFIAVVAIKTGMTPMEFEVLSQENDKIFDFWQGVNETNEARKSLWRKRK